VAPEESKSEIAAAEPYFIGSHSGASGAWVSGPEDLQTPETKDHYFWGYGHMATTPGIFCAGDASGASSHKFSSGSHAEGRIAAKEAIRYIVDNPAEPVVDNASSLPARTPKGALQPRKPSATSLTIPQNRWLIMPKPLDIYNQNKDYSSDNDIHPEYIKPKMFMFRLQKIMDEYAGGVSSQFKTSKSLLEKGLQLLSFLKEDSEKLAAEDLHELMRCWENIHRMWQAEAHVRTILFREETRWPPTLRA